MKIIKVKNNQLAIAKTSSTDKEDNTDIAEIINEQTPKTNDTRMKSMR